MFSEEAPTPALNTKQRQADRLLWLWSRCPIEGQRLLLVLALALAQKSDEGEEKENA